MPIPQQYALASQMFEAFMEALRVRLGHATRHQTFQSVQSVLLVFRRRLDVSQGLIFADMLPAVLRAMFVEGWNPTEAPRPFATRAELTAEVKAHRSAHEFSPPTVISDMAAVLREHVDASAFDKALARLPRQAAAFWSAPPHEIEEAHP